MSCALLILSKATVTFYFCDEQCDVHTQGTEDEVVPPNQATDMYQALKEQGLTTALVMFEGEQHGFRQAINIRRALDGEFFFYGKALGFKAEMPEGLEPITVVN